MWSHRDLPRLRGNGWGYCRLAPIGEDRMKPNAFWATLSSLVGVVALGAFSRLPAQDVTTGLVTNLQFDGTSNDSSVNRFTFTEAGTMRYVADRLGNANRALEFVTPPSDDGFLKGPGPNLANQSHSVSFWVKKNYSGGDGVGVFGLLANGAPDSPGTRLTVFLNYGLSIRFTFWYDDFDSATPLVQGVWYHLTFTFDNSTKSRRIYINGQLDSTKQAAYAFSGGNTLQISAKYTTLDDFRLYNRALSAQDVAALAVLQVPAEVPPTITVQPASQVVAAGGVATLSVSATGNAPLKYEWRKDGVNLVGATGATYSVSNMQDVNIGDYSVVVSSSASTVTSASAALSIAGVQSGIWRGLVAYYPFSGNANDQSPFANHATVAGNSQFISTGVSGGAFRIIGDSALFYAGGGHALLPKFGSYMNAGFTISMWVRDEALINTSAIHEQSYLTFGPLDQPQVDIALNSETQRIRYIVDGGSGGVRSDIFAPISFSTGLAAWKHVVLSYAPGKFIAYLNGVKVDERAVTANIFPSTTAGLGRGWWNGGASSATRMSVTYDNVRIYSRTLADADVQTLYASEAPPAPLVAAAVTAGPTSLTVVAGQMATLSVSAIGTAPLTYQWRRDGVAIAGATGATLTLTPSQVGSAAYTVVVANAIGSTTSAPATLTVKSANPGRLTNLSIRTVAGAGSGSLIVGFVLGGSGTSGNAALLARAAGPGLAQFGITGTLPDPILSLFNNGRLIGSNDDWSGPAVAAVSASVGAFAFPASSKDSAIASSLALGGYTAQVSDVGGAAGVSLVELYEAGEGFSYARPRLINVSARASAGSAGGTMIAGFVIKGETPVTILVRGIGPGLSQFGVTGVLGNPKLTLFRDSTVVAINDNWADVGAAALASTANAVGAFALPTNSLDAALLATLEPGSYTAQVSGVDPTAATGIALVEIYEVP